jgi:hypothetical protein
MNPNRPTGSLAPAPLEGPPGSFRISEEVVTVRRYTTACDMCQRRFSHRDRATLESNIIQHFRRWHGVEAEKRDEMERIGKEIARINKSLNQRYGR